MKLIELIEYFRNGGDFEQFCLNQSLDIDAEAIEIFGATPLHLDMELAFFPVEETEGKIKYTKKGIDYSNLFDFYYFLDVVAESEDATCDLSNKKVAETLLSFVENDA